MCRNGSNTHTQTTSIYEKKMNDKRKKEIELSAREVMNKLVDVGYLEFFFNEKGEESVRRTQEAEELSTKIDNDVDIDYDDYKDELVYFLLTHKFPEEEIKGTLH